LSHAREPLIDLKSDLREWALVRAELLHRIDDAEHGLLGMILHDFSPLEAAAAQRIRGECVVFDQDGNAI
jgi:hypothetical protein